MASETSKTNTHGTKRKKRPRRFLLRLKMKVNMEIPDQEEKEKFSSALFKDKASEMRVIRHQYDLNVERLRYLVGDLEALWYNDLQTSFIADLGNVQSGVAEYSALMEQYAVLLEFLASELDQKKIAPDITAAEETGEPTSVTFTTVPEVKMTGLVDEQFGPFGIAPSKTEDQKGGALYALFEFLTKFGVKNPFGPERIQLYLCLKSRALDLRARITQFDYNVHKIRNLTEAQLRLWDNDYQTALVEEMHGLENPVKDFSSLVDEYATLIEMAAEELKTKSVDTDKASVLSDGSDGPVTVVLTNIPYLKRSRMDIKAYDPYFEQTQIGVATEVSMSRKNAEYLYNVFEDHVELVKYIGLKKIVEIPGELDGLPVTHIGLDCFAMAWRVKFTSITMPDSITTVFHGAFRGCISIRELKLSKNLKYVGNYAFAFITDLEYISLPDNIVSFGMGAFRNCVNLKSVSIPTRTLKRIGNDCFYGCKRLECVVIGDDVVEIDDWAFRLCEHLTSVTIGENVAEIGESAFYDCIRLERLDIPETVAKIGDTAFYSRRSITLGVTPGSAAEKYAIENHIDYVTA